jgi:hypothetical protein
MLERKAQRKSQLKRMLSLPNDAKTLYHQSNRNISTYLFVVTFVKTVRIALINAAGHPSN